MSTFRHSEAPRPSLASRIKPWQWAAIVMEALLLFGVLGVSAWLLLFNRPAAQQTVAQAATPTFAGPTSPASTQTPTPHVWATPLLTRTPAPTNTRVVSRSLVNQAAIDDIERQVALVRGLKPRATVPSEFLTRAEMVDYVRQEYNSNRDAALQELALYRALGLIQPGVQVDAETTVKWIASNIAGFYDPKTKRLHVISDLENMGADEKVVLAHEYTHALQDQQFDLAKYQSRTPRDTTDAELARTSVYEGDATTVMSLYLYGNTTQSDWDYLAYRAAFNNPSIITATGVSTRVSEISYFPYAQGAQFIIALMLDGKGWAEVNHAYVDPPQSTSQVLHPSRYLTRLATPVPITLPDLSSVLGKEFTLTIKADTLGEFVTSVHLDEFLHDPKRAAQAADGWEGDSFSLWQASNDRQAFAWQIAWDTPRDVGEFFDTYSDLLRKRVGSDVTAERENANVRWYFGSGGSGLIRRTNVQTLVLWGPDKAAVERMLTVFR
jgi:hypothetical protein